MIVISGTALIIIAVIYVAASVFLASILWDDLKEDVSLVMFLMFSPLIVLGGFLAACCNATAAINRVRLSCLKRIPGERLRLFIQRMRGRQHGHMTHILSLKREVQWAEQRLESAEAETDRRAHRLAEGVLNQHWLDATVKVREALSGALTEACKLATEAADKSESEALEALRIRAEAAEERAKDAEDLLELSRITRKYAVHGRTPGGEQGSDPGKAR